MNNLGKIQAIKLQQQSELNQQLAKFRAIKLRFTERKSNEAEALLSKAMINSEIQRLFDKEIEIELYLKTVSNERKQQIENEQKILELQGDTLSDNIIKLEADLARKNIELDDEAAIIRLQIEELKAKKKNILLTSLVASPQQSDTPIGVSGKLILILSLLVDGFIGLFAVFIAEFFEKIRA